MNHVNSILPAGETLESDSTWADQVRYQAGWKWSAPLHFINTPDWACDFQPARDCADKMCVYGAILNYTARLAKQTGEQRYEALKFVDHFLGDIHQPLHCAFASDYGGNSIEGTYMGQSVNLHHLWDYNLLATRITNDFNNDQDSFAAWLLQQIQGPWQANVTTWTSCVTPGDASCVQGWAEESTGLACTYAYTDENGNHIANGFDLGTPYYDFTIPVIEMQLAKGAVRLAGLLNKVWSSVSVDASTPLLAVQ